MKRKVGNEKFRKRNRPPLAISSSKIILTNPAIYTPLANAVIHYRLVNWQFPYNDQESTRNFCIESYLSAINKVLHKNKLPTDQIRRITILSSKLLGKLLIDPETNSAWASAAVVDIIRNFNIYTFLTRHLLVYRIIDARGEFITDYQCKQNMYSNERLLCEKKIAAKEYNVFLHDLKIKNPFYSFSQAMIQTILIFLEPLILFALFAKIFSIEFLSIKKENLWYLLPLCFFISTLLKTTRRVFSFSDHNFYSSPNAFNVRHISSNLKSSLFQSMAENLREVMEESKPPTEIKRIKEKEQNPSTTEQSPQTVWTETKDQDLVINTQRKIKLKTQSSLPDFLNRHNRDSDDELIDYQNCNYIDLILNSAKLVKALELVWESKDYGKICFKWGSPETYKLWSNKSNWDQELKFCFAHFPTQKLLAENDNELIAAFKKVASIGHVVENKGQGYVRTSEQTFKIKLFTKNFKNYRMPVELVKTKLCQFPVGYEHSRLFVAKNPIEKKTCNEKRMQTLYSRRFPPSL